MDLGPCSEGTKISVAHTGSSAYVELITADNFRLLRSNTDYQCVYSQLMSNGRFTHTIPADDHWYVVAVGDGTLAVDLFLGAQLPPIPVIADAGNAGELNLASDPSPRHSHPLPPALPLPAMPTPPKAAASPESQPGGLEQAGEQVGGFFEGIVFEIGKLVKDLIDTGAFLVSLKDREVRDAVSAYLKNFGWDEVKALLGDAWNDFYAKNEWEAGKYGEALGRMAVNIAGLAVGATQLKGVVTALKGWINGLKVFVEKLGKKIPSGTQWIGDRLRDIWGWAKNRWSSMRGKEPGEESIPKRVTDLASVRLSAASETRVAALQKMDTSDLQKYFLTETGKSSARLSEDIWGTNKNMRDVPGGPTRQEQFADHVRSLIGKLSKEDLESKGITLEGAEALLALYRKAAEASNSRGESRGGFNAPARVELLENVVGILECG